MDPGYIFEIVKILIVILGLTGCAIERTPEDRRQYIDSAQLIHDRIMRDIEALLNETPANLH